MGARVQDIFAVLVMSMASFVAAFLLYTFFGKNGFDLTRSLEPVNMVGGKSQEEPAKELEDISGRVLKVEATLRAYGLAEVGETKIRIDLLAEQIRGAVLQLENLTIKLDKLLPG